MDRRRGGRAYGGGGGGGGGGASAASGAAASGLAGSPGGSTGLADSVARVSTTGGTGVGPASSGLSLGCDGLAASASASAFTSVAVASMVGGSRPLRGVFPSLAIASFSRAHQRHNADPRRRQSGHDPSPGTGGITLPAPVAPLRRDAPQSGGYVPPLPRAARLHRPTGRTAAVSARTGAPLSPVQPRTPWRCGRKNAARRRSHPRRTRI